MTVNNTIKTWEYKDASRDWWMVELWQSGERDNGLGNESKDCEWEYRIVRDLKVIYRATIVGQYDEVPSLQDVLEDFSSYFMSVVIGFSRYGDKENAG